MSDGGNLLANWRSACWEAEEDRCHAGDDRPMPTLLRAVRQKEREVVEYCEWSAYVNVPFQRDGQPRPKVRVRLLILGETVGGDAGREPSEQDIVEYWGGIQWTKKAYGRPGKLKEEGMREGAGVGCLENV